MKEGDQEQGSLKSPASLAANLRSVTTELRTLDQHLKARPLPDGTALREFRQALDNVRLTAWTVDELIKARRIKTDPQAVLLFLSVERLRRFSQIVNDLCSDLERGDFNWPIEGVQGVRESLKLLRERLGHLD